MTETVTGAVTETVTGTVTGTGTSPGHFYLKNIKIHCPGHSPGPGYFLRTVVSRSITGSVQLSVSGTEELLKLNCLKDQLF